MTTSPQIGTALRLRLMWIRRVVDDFPAALRVYRPAMSPVVRPAAGEPERWEEHGWVRLWDRSPQIDSFGTPLGAE